MLIASLVASLVALAFCCLGLLGFCLWLLRRQRLLAEQVDLARRVTELGRAARAEAIVEGMKSWVSCQAMAVAVIVAPWSAATS